MDPELYSTIKSGNTAAFQKAVLLHENTLEATTMKNDTVLHVACKFGRVAMAELILGQRREMVNTKNVYGETPMHVTCMRGHLHVLKMLMESNHNQSAAADVDNHGRSPLYMACYYNRFLLVEHLLQYTWIPASDEDGGLCLHIATSRGYGDVVRVLLKAHPNLALKVDAYGNTTLHVAVSNRYFQIAGFLINNTRVDVDARNIKGKTAFDIVAEYGSHDLASKVVHELLLEKQRINGQETKDESFPDIPAEDLDPFPQQLDEDEEIHQEQVSVDLERHKLKSMNRRKSLKELYRKQQQEKARKTIYEEALQNARNTVVIVSVLIATVAFTAGVSPPGGVYQDGPHIGKSVLAKTTAFKVFLVSNTLALFASLGIVIVLVSVIPFRRKPLMRMLKYSHRAMWVAVFFMATAFVAAVWATLPIEHPYEKDGTEWVKAVLLVVAGGSLGAVFFGWSYMLGAHLKRKSKWRRTRIHDSKEETDSAKGEDDNGVKVPKRRLSEDFGTGSSISDYASSSNLGYHPV